MNKLISSRTILLVSVFCVMGAIASPPTTFKSLVSFNGTDGANPEFIALVQGQDGKYYGITFAGGSNSLGTVFNVTSRGTLTRLHSFAGYPTEGAYPYAGLVLGEDGNFYGTTTYGGSSNLCGGYSGFAGCGTVFKITPSGALTTLYNFCSQSGCADGELPAAGVVQGTDRNFYGTTWTGLTIPNYETVFS